VARYFVYVMTNHSGTLYTGVTSDLRRRVWEHKQGVVEGFTRRYNVKRLVFFEETADVNAAIARERQLKSWRRSKKVALIESVNPGWKDLSEGWYE
jgi:putative endonuclease